MRIPGVAGAAGCAVLIAVALTACGASHPTGQASPEVSVSSGDAQPETGLAPVRFDKMLVEFVSTTSTLTLPAGAAFTDPTNPGPEKLPDGTTGESTYEPGYGSVLAYQEWFCAWEAQWLKVQGQDEDASKKALAAMKTFPDTDVFKRFFDPDSAQVNIRTMLQKAELGDPTMISNDVKMNCGHW